MPYSIFLYTTEVSITVTNSSKEYLLNCVTSDLLKGEWTTKLAETIEAAGNSSATVSLLFIKHAHTQCTRTAEVKT